jgi:threonine/homoserine/homoserine lactone efflux protein
MAVASDDRQGPRRRLAHVDVSQVFPCRTARPGGDCAVQACFHEGVLFQWVNPKALILVISAAGAYIAIAESIVQRMLIIVGIFFVAGLVSCSIWMIAGDALNRYLSSGESARYVNLGMGILILLTALHILLG